MNSKQKMIKIARLKGDEIPEFRKLMLTIFNEGFSYYPPKAQEYNKKYWSKKRLAQYILKKNRLLLLAKDDDRGIGYLIGKYYSTGKSLILWLGVLKSQRGMGVGGQMVKFWEQWAKIKGAHTLRASTANFANDQFYRKLGFTKSATFEKNDWGMKKLVFIKKLT